MLLASSRSSLAFYTALDSTVWVFLNYYHYNTSWQARKDLKKNNKNTTTNSPPNIISHIDEALPTWIQGETKQKPYNIQPLHSPNILNFFVLFSVFSSLLHTDLEHILISATLSGCHTPTWSLLGDDNNSPTPWEAEELPFL